MSAERGGHMKSMRILLTGHDGYIGHVLLIPGGLLALISLGHWLEARARDSYDSGEGGSRTGVRSKR